MVESLPSKQAVAGSNPVSRSNPFGLFLPITLFRWSYAVKRVGFLLKVRQDLLDEYKEHHRNVWPEMLDALRRNGWRNYSLFAREDGLLFGYFEAEEDFAAALEGMSGEDANARWQEFMAPYFEIPPGARPDEMMVELEEVFHTE